MILSETIDVYLQSSLNMSDLREAKIVEVEDSNAILSDLDHFLELEDLSDDQVRALTSRRVKTLSDRRRAKNMIRVIDQILPKQIEGRTTHDRYEFAIRNLEERVYTPRKITLEEACAKFN